MKNKIPYLVIIILLIASFYLYSKFNIAPALNLKTLNLIDLNENTVKLEKFKDKKIVICFSASWCQNCLQELEDINSIQDKSLKNVEIIIISDESLEKIKSFKTKKKYNFTFLKLSSSFNSIGINSIPTSYLVNTKFKITKETVGYLNWKDPSTCFHLCKMMD